MLSIGIHISQNSICFTELSLEELKPKLLSFEEQFFKTEDLEKEKHLLISRYLESVEKKHKGKTLRFCYSLPQSSVSNFLVNFPFKEKFKILKTLPFEIEDNSPFNPNKVFFDARICKITNNKTSSVLCFVTPEENVKEFLKFSDKLKSSPYLLSCEGSALANLLEFWNKNLSQAQNLKTNSLYIYLGQQNSQLLLYRKGHLANISVLDWSVAPIIKEMEELYKLTSEKAWQEFVEKAFILTETKGFTKEQVFFSRLVKKQVDLLVPKLRLLKMSIETEQEIQIKDIFLFGPGSVIKNLTAFLTTEMSIKTSRLKKLISFSDFDLQEKPSFLISLGLALEGLKSSPYQGLNFLQSMKKEAFSLFSKKWQKTAMAFLFCFVVFTSYAFIRKQESSKILDKVELVFINYGKKIAFMRESQISIDSLKSFLEKQKDKRKNEQIIKEKLNKAHPIDYLKWLTQKLDSSSAWDLKIHYLKIENRQVEIRGLVKKDYLQKLKSQLQKVSKTRVKEKSVENTDKSKKWGASKEKDNKLEVKDNNLEAKDNKLEVKDNNLEAKDNKLEAKAKDSKLLEFKDNKLEAKDNRLEVKDNNLEAKDSKLEAKDSQLEVSLKDSKLEAKAKDSQLEVSLKDSKLLEFKDNKSLELQDERSGFYYSFELKEEF